MKNTMSYSKGIASKDGLTSSAATTTSTTVDNGEPDRSSRKRSATLWLEQQRFDHGLCTLCGSQLYNVATDKDNKKLRKLEPTNVPGLVMNGRCLQCYPTPNVGRFSSLRGSDQVDSCLPAFSTRTPSSPDQIAVEKQKESSELAIKLITADAAIAPASPIMHTIRDADGLEYPGSIQGGIRTQGIGKFCHSSPGRLISYEGEFEGTHMNGYGTSHDFSMGCKYVGEFFKGAAHGTGRCIWDQGWEYMGEWQLDKRHGKGKCWQVQEGGETYDGDWLRDKWDGQGILAFAGGGKYTGSFRQDKLHGNGIYEFADGSVYKGSFLNDLRHGHGAMSYGGGGVRYVGNWRENWRSGQGSLYYSNGTIFKGSFTQDKKDGVGYLHFADGIIRKEKWQSGMLLGS